MASKKRKAAGSPRKQTARKGTSLSLAGRLKKWFVNIITELKRVIWPDKKKLRQSTMTVLLIIAISVVIILVFDTLITFVMRTTGVYSTKDQPADSDAPITEQEQTRRDGYMPGVYLSSGGVRIVFEG